MKSNDRLNGCVYLAIVTPSNALAQGWALMLAVGIIHSEWIPALPTIGYWWAVLIVFLLSGSFSRTRTWKEMRDS